MAKPLLPDDVWQVVQPLLPPAGPRRTGRPAIADRDILTGVVFVLKTGIPWQDLPLELGSGSGMTCLRRLRAWQRSGVWQRVQPLLASRLPGGTQINWARVGDGPAEPSLARVVPTDTIARVPVSADRAVPLAAGHCSAN